MNPFGFSNEYFDETTGQVEFLNRKYFPQLGKFASRDTIGVQGGLNEYAICANDLINKFDLWGKIAVSVSESIEYRKTKLHGNFSYFYIATIKQIGKLDKGCYLNVLQLKYVNNTWSIDGENKDTFPYYFTPSQAEKRTITINGSKILEFGDVPGGALNSTIYYYMLPVEICLKCYKDPFYRMEAKTKILDKKFWGYNMNTREFYYAAAGNLPNVDIKDFAEDKLKQIILSNTDKKAYKYRWPYLFNFKVIME
ncbi:MAG: hypothetical protein PF692_08545 [Kiritimatiellae bacterium]|nr:hypothetical protein [Kiritimatiellia bacterium]